VPHTGSVAVMRPDLFVDSGFQALQKLFNLFLPYLFTSLTIGPFRFQVRGRKRQLNLALVFFVYLVLQYILLQMRVCFCYVRFSLSVLSQDIGWEERL